MTTKDSNIPPELEIMHMLEFMHVLMQLHGDHKRELDQSQFKLVLKWFSTYIEHVDSNE